MAARFLDEEDEGQVREDLRQAFGLYDKVRAKPELVLVTRLDLLKYSRRDEASSLPRF